jgi:hypothetical protein
MERSGVFRGHRVAIDLAAQGIRAAREGADGTRLYRLAWLLRCGTCRRRLESCWSNRSSASARLPCSSAPSSASSPHQSRPHVAY